MFQYDIWITWLTYKVKVALRNYNVNYIYAILWKWTKIKKKLLLIVCGFCIYCNLFIKVTTPKFILNCSFWVFFNVVPSSEETSFLTTFYGLYFSHQLHILHITNYFHIILHPLMDLKLWTLQINYCIQIYCVLLLVITQSIKRWSETLHPLYNCLSTHKP